MCKTADPRTRPLLALVLFFCAVCLGVHFLAEDALFYTAAKSSAEAGSTSQMPQNESDHQDDLVMVVELPQYLASKEPPAAFRWVKPGERRADIPISTPPKIA